MAIPIEGRDRDNRSSTADHGVQTVIYLKFDGEWVVGRDEDTEVASQGKTREAPLENLDQAVALHRGDAGEPVADEDLEDVGIDPDAAPDDPQVLDTRVRR